MAILIKLLAGGLDLAAMAGIETVAAAGIVALAGGIGRHMLRPRTAL